MPTYGGTTYGGAPYAGPPVPTSPYVETNQGLFPVRIIEAAFGYGPNDTNPVWVDITSDVTQYSTRRGRQAVLSRFEAGTAQIVLDNKSGKYSPFNSSSPYFGNIRPGLPIRIRALWGAVTYPRFYGFVESWPLTWPGPNDSTVTVSAVDYLKFLNLKKATSINYYSGVIPADTPMGWWRGNDAAGSTTMADSSGNGRTATKWITNPVLTSPNVTWQFQDAPLLTADTSPSLYLGYHEVEFQATVPSIDATVNFSFEAWVSLMETDKAYFVEGQPGAATEFALMYDGSHASWSGPFSPAVTGPSLSANQTHHLVGTCTGGVGVVPILTLYVDGNQVGQAQSTGGVGWSGSFTSIRIGGTFGTTQDNPLSNGNIQEVAVYNYVLTPTQVMNHYLAGTQPRRLETTGARISYLATYTGMPAASQKIDAGNTVVVGATDDWLKQTILSNLQAQADTEMGDLFIDAAGNLTFFDRNHTSHSPYSGVSVILGDSGAPPEEPYRLDGTAVPYDDLNVWNEVVATPAGQAAQTASDTTSWQQYGRRTRTLSLLSSTTADALSRATFEMNTYKSAQPRIDSIVINPADDPTMLFGPVLGSDLLTRVELRRRPMDGSGSLFDQTALIEGIEEKVTKATWETTWRLSAVDATMIGIFNESTFGNAVFGW